MSRRLPVSIIVLTAALVALGSVHLRRPKPTTPDGAVKAMLAEVKAKNWDSAFDFVANHGNLQKSDFISDLGGRDASLRTYSALEKVDTSVLHQNKSDALVRASLRFSSAVGALEDTRDLRVVREDSEWKVVWPVEKESRVPPQVIPVNFLRWDVIYRGAEDDWGAQDAAPPKVRITSMNAIEHGSSVIILGEMVNEDTVPGFVSVNATLIGKNADVLGEETAFDKISHILLPKEVSPFRIDFPGVRLTQVQSVRITPNALLVGAAADPVVGAIHQRLASDSLGQQVLTGELQNEGGQTVHIAHVLATFYNNSGRVVWVSDGYVDHALLPGIPEPFAVAVASDLTSKVQTYRVTVNKFSWGRQQ
jgi:hypothetical protein